MRILIGTVPYGADNVGDEAILATIVHDVKKTFPKAEITVSTGTPDLTSKKLSVRTVPLFGFHSEALNSFNFTGITAESRKLLKSEMRRTDIYIWGGATGLSDYPHYGTYIAKLAKKFSKMLILYSVGMNKELWPNVYKIGDGKKKTILNFCEKVMFNSFNLVKLYENTVEKSAKQLIKKSLNNADLIIARDKDSKKEIEKCGVIKPIHVTSDPALLLKSVSEERLDEIWKEQGLWDTSLPIIGISIASQISVLNLEKLVRFIDDLIEQENVNIIFIPMNPITDIIILGEIHSKMQNHERVKLLKGFFEPEEIVAVTSRLSLVISSRLHFLILSSINHVPLVGFSLESKVSSYLSLFGENVSPSVESYEFDDLKVQCSRLLKESSLFREKAKKVVSHLQDRVRTNINYMSETVNKHSRDKLL